MTRALILIALGWLLLAAASPPQQKAERPHVSAAQQTNEPGSGRSPVPVEVVNQPVEPRGYQDPCRYDESDKRSDLCAQWTAARGASEVAYYTRLQLWVAGAGMIGLLITIVLTLLAVKAARASVTVAQDTANRQLRAYVFPQAVTWEIRQSGKRFYMIFRVAWKNLGSTPTKHLRISNVGTLDGVEMNAVAGFDEATHFLLGPGAEVRSNSVVLNMTDAHAVYAGKKHFRLIGFAFYQDIFSQTPRKTRYCYRVRLFRDPTKPLRGTNFNWIEWEIEGAYNCADEECDLIEAVKHDSPPSTGSTAIQDERVKS
jgi:hypothetical protein